MVHKLALIAISGITLSAVCLGAGGALEGRDFGHDFGDGDFSLFDSRPRCEADGVPAPPAATWNGTAATMSAFNLLGQASYTPGTDDKLHASGDPQVLAHLRIHEGQIEMDCRGWKERTQNIVVTLPGREFDKFGVSGGHLVLDKLKQSYVSIAIGGSGHVKANGTVSDLKLAVGGSGDMDLDQITAENGKLDIGGSGTVRAKGAIQELKISIGGSGRADFGAVASRIATVKIGGNGNVDIAPTEEADIRIGGSGDVTLHSNPKQLETRIGGSGRIHRLAGG